MRRNVYIGGEYTGLQYHRVFYCFPISTCTITLWLRLSTPQVRRCGRQVTAIAAVTQLSVRRTPVFDMLSTPYNWKYSHGCFVQFTVLAIVKPNRIVSCVLRKKKIPPLNVEGNFSLYGGSLCETFLLRFFFVLRSLHDGNKSSLNSSFAVISGSVWSCWSECSWRQRNGDR